MFTITFKKSRSKNFLEAWDLAMELGAICEGKEIRLEINDYELFQSYQKLLPLIALIQKWKGVTATFNGRPVDLYKFVFKVCHHIVECAEYRNGCYSDQGCWKNDKQPGWKCKLLDRPKRHITGTGDYKSKFLYWYNYGSFNEAGDWVVDKTQIWKVLKRNIEDNYIDACPFYSEQRIKDIVFKDLPDLIIPEGERFRILYSEDYKDWKLQNIPVNIRHVFYSPSRIELFNYPAIWNNEDVGMN